MDDSIAVARSSQATAVRRVAIDLRAGRVRGRIARPDGLQGLDLDAHARHVVVDLGGGDVRFTRVDELFPSATAMSARAAAAATAMSAATSASDAVRAVQLEDRELGKLSSSGAIQ